MFRSDERSINGGNRRMKQNACKLSLSTWLLVRLWHGELGVTNVEAHVSMLEEDSTACRCELLRNKLESIVLKCVLVCDGHSSIK